MTKIMFYSRTMSSGGSERVISILANEMVKRMDVSIATLSKSKLYYDLDINIKLIESRDYNKLTIVKNIINLYKKTLKYKPDIIIAFCPTMCFIAGFLRIFSRKFRKIKLIMSERNDPNNKYSNFVSKKLANFFYKRADIVVFQNNGARSFFSKKVQNKGVIIPNPINDKFLNCNINVKKENSIVNVSRLEPQKNQELLIKSCSEVFKKHPDWKLKIYGEGGLKTKLNDLIKELKMNNNIFLMGRCNELEKELPKNKIFVLSSNYEGMPNALMEAMASGLLCISTDCPCGGPKELINNSENGFLVSVNDEKKLTKTILKVIENTKNEKEIISKAVESIKRFSGDKIIALWYTQIENLIKNRRSDSNGKM